MGAPGRGGGGNNSRDGQNGANCNDLHSSVNNPGSSPAPFRSAGTIPADVRRVQIMVEEGTGANVEATTPSPAPPLARPPAVPSQHQVARRLAPSPDDDGPIVLSRRQLGGGHSYSSTARAVSNGNFNNNNQDDRAGNRGLAPAPSRREMGQNRQPSGPQQTVRDWFDARKYNRER